MARDVTVTLQDGSQHVYQSAPDDITPDVVSARAEKDFGQPVTHLDGGKGTASANPVIDAIRAIPGGFAQGVAGVAGLSGTVSDALSHGLDYLANKVTGANVDTGKSPLSGAALNQDISSPTGGYYQPQTTLGNYAQTAASFVPALAGGEAALGRKLVGRVLAPAAGATAAGSALSPEQQQTHPYLNAALQTGGALLGGGLVSGTRGVLGAAKTVDPETAANNYLAKALADQGTTAADISANAIRGKGQLGAEAMGQGGVDMLATLGRRPGTTPQQLADVLATRQAQQPQQILNDFASASGIDPRAAQGNIDALVEAGQARAAPLYRAALSSAPAVTNPELAELASRPVIKQAMSAAATDIRNGGGDPTRIGLHFDEDGNMTARPDPTPEAWDLTKKAMNGLVERDPFGNRLPDSASPGNYRISKATAQLTDAMKNAIPGYGDALKVSGDYLTLKNAFDKGGDHILDPNVTAAQVADHVSDMTPAELNAYKGGIANEIFNKAQNAKLAPRILNTPAVQGKLQAALGTPAANTFMTNLQQRIELGQTGARMYPRGGSITANMLLNSGEQDAAGALNATQQGLHAASNLVHGNVLGAAGNGLGAIRYWAPDFLRSGAMNAETRNALGNALMLPPNQLAQRLSALQVPTTKAPLLARLLQESQ